jgi:hypothetical protein
MSNSTECGSAGDMPVHEHTQLGTTAEQPSLKVVKLQAQLEYKSTESVGAGYGIKCLSSQTLASWVRILFEEQTSVRVSCVLVLYSAGRSLAV